MASTLLNAVIRANIYKINSNQIIDRTLYPYGMPMLFGTGATGVQPNSGATVADLQGGTTALLYSRITNSAYPNTVFFSDVTVAAIVTQLAT